jgi:hypothetical protein
MRVRRLTDLLINEDSLDRASGTGVLCFMRGDWCTESQLMPPVRAEA